MQDLNSPTRDQTYAPCSGSIKSWPLDHQESLRLTFFLSPAFISWKISCKPHRASKRKKERDKNNFKDTKKLEGAHNEPHENYSYFSICFISTGVKFVLNHLKVKLQILGHFTDLISFVTKLRSFWSWRPLSTTQDYQSLQTCSLPQAAAAEEAPFPKGQISPSCRARNANYKDITAKHWFCLGQGPLNNRWC